MGKKQARCDKHNRRQCWDCRLEAYRLADAQVRARKLGLPKPDKPPPLKKETADEMGKRYHRQGRPFPTHPQYGRLVYVGDIFRKALAQTEDPHELIAARLDWSLSRFEKTVARSYMYEGTALKLCAALHVRPGDVGF